jgi:hypothetical protein
VSLQVSDAVIWQESGEGISLYNTETGDFVSLNGTGAQIWVLVASDGAREPVISKLSLLYAGPDTELSDRISADVEEFIASMLESGLLVETAAA